MGRPTSPDASFVTAAAAPPLLLSGPTATAVTGTGATISWTTDEPATSVVEYGQTPRWAELEAYRKELIAMAGGRAAHT